MIMLKKSARSWGSESFDNILKNEIIELDRDTLPLQESASPGMVAVGSDIDIMILSKNDDDINIKVKIGVIFSEVLGGYCCGEEEPIVQNAYSELSVLINKTTSETSLSIL